MVKDTCFRVFGLESRKSRLCVSNREQSCRWGSLFRRLVPVVQSLVSTVLGLRRL